MAKKTITINVLQRHINQGEQSETNTCAIALAVAEKFGLNKSEVRENELSDYDDEDGVSGDAVKVTGEEIKVRKANGFSFKFDWSKLPASVERFINKFDNDKKSVKPFSFKLPFIN